MMKIKQFMLIGLALVLGQSLALAQAVKVDGKLPTYKKVSGISGNLSSVGSDTLNNVMALWAESFRKLYPNVNIQVEGKGSTTAPPALAQGTAQIAPMSRPMKDEEIQMVEKAHGFKPTTVGVALDSLAVFVNKDNPIQSLTMEQVDGIFSKTRKSGSPEINTWGQLGLKGDWANRPISLYGRNSASGTYGYFKEHALFKGDYRDSVKEQPGSAAVVLGVSSDLGAAGYSGIGYKTSGVRAVPLAAKQGEPAAEANYKNVLERKYPMSRMLFINVLKKPGEPLSPLVREFIIFTLSRQGQEVVVKDGYLPLPAELAKKQLAAIQ